MRRNIYGSSVLKLALIVTVLVLVFCAGLASYAQSTVSGTITRGGVPCPDARVILTDTATGSYVAARTNVFGCYSITGVATGDYTFTANALRAVPVVDKAVSVNDTQVTVSVDLTFGDTPLFDDFSGTELDVCNPSDPTGNQSSRWVLYNAFGSQEGVGASIENGSLRIDATQNMGGVISRNPFPKYGTFEFVWPKRYEGTDQCFTLIKDKSPYDSYVNNYTNYFTVQDIGSTVASLAYAKGYNNSTTREWTRSTAYGLYYPTKVTILKTGSYLDFFFLNNICMKSSDSAMVADEVYVYLYGNEASGATTVAFFDDIYAGATVPVTVSNVIEARSAATGNKVAIGKAVVTASFDDAFWVESLDRSSGIKVISTAKPTVGKGVIIKGTVVRENNEVALQAEDVVIGGTVTTTPFAVAITGKAANEYNKAGATAQGMIVKVTGKVTEVVTDTENISIEGYYLDDGSGITAGTHKGLYVKIADFITLPASVVNQGDFITIEGPLTVAAVDNGTYLVPSIVAARGLDYGPVGFIAYNDVVQSPKYPSFGGPNITHYSALGNDNVADDFPGGPLKDYATGNYIGESAVVTASGTVSELQQEDGGNPVTGDAKTYFTDELGNWIVDFRGCLYTPEGTYESWWVDVTFYGLDPKALYEFVGTVDRNESRNLPVLFRISDFAACDYACSDITPSYSASKVSETGIYYGSGIPSSHDSGYVARWINIKPLPNGTFKVRSNCASVAQGGYGIGGFRLRKQAGPEVPPTYSTDQYWRDDYAYWPIWQ
ncbi:MAG: carboxypeptidase regulatory-like domain-containing protein [Armatimonadota bacterium]